MTRPKTTIVNSPWSALAQKSSKKNTKSKTPKRAEPVCVDELVVCDDPPPRTTLGQRASKYAERFEKLKVGQSLKCDTKNVTIVAGAMRAWLKRSGRDGHQAVVSVSDYGDGKGRVWLVAKDKKEKAE